MIRDKRRKSTRWEIIIMALWRTVFILPVSIALAGCGTTSYLMDASYMQDYPVEPLEVLNPALNGTYKYHTYFYGSGDDKHRSE